MRIDRTVQPQSPSPAGASRIGIRDSIAVGVPSGIARRSCAAQRIALGRGGRSQPGSLRQRPAIRGDDRPGRLRRGHRQPVHAAEARARQSRYDGAERIEVTITAETKTILGVPATVVRDQVFAQRGAGRGHIRLVRAGPRTATSGISVSRPPSTRDGKIVSTAGSWEAGVDGALPGIIMLADPRVGRRLSPGVLRGPGGGLAEVTGSAARSRCRSGTFNDNLVTEEWTPLEPDVRERKTYARGIGLVEERAIKGGRAVVQMAELQARRLTADLSAAERRRRPVYASPSSDHSSHRIRRRGGRTTDATRRPRSAPAGELDRRQGVDDPEAREGGPRCGQAGRAGHALPGAVLRPLLLPGPGSPVLQLHGADPGRPDHEADAGPCEGDGHGPRRADVRGGRQGVGHLLQHRRGHRRRRQVPRQVPQDPHPPRQGLLGEVLLPARQHRLPGVRDRRRQGRRLHLLRPPLSGGRAGARPERGGDRDDPVGHVARPVGIPVANRAGLATPSRTATSSGRSTGSASRRRSATTTSTARVTSSTRAASSSASWARPTTRS